MNQLFLHINKYLVKVFALLSLRGDKRAVGWVGGWGRRLVRPCQVV